MSTNSHSIRSRFAAFFAARSGTAGNVAVIFALSLPLVVGAASFGVETTYWAFKSAHMQQAADAAAHAGAIEKRAGASTALVTAIATQTARDNGFDTGSGTVEVNTPPISGSLAGKPAVEVILRSPAERFFSALLTADVVMLKTRAVAAFSSASSACILALNPSASKAALFAGNTTATLTGCSVMANSVATDAVVVQGSALLSTDCLISGGGAQTTAGLTLTSCKSVTVNAPPVADPYAAIPAPTGGGTCRSSKGGTLQPGSYCSGLNLKGSVNLNSGVYHISGGDLTINSLAAITGTGVTIYLASGSHMSINGNATVQLSAPTSGTYAGMLFMGDRTGAGGNNKINGTSSSILTGVIYFPKDAVDFLGNFSGAGGCTRLVADTVTWSGNTTVANDCSIYGMQPIPVLNLIKLKE